MRLDDVLEQYIGSCGKFQILVLVVVGLENIFMAMQTMAPIYLAATPPKYWCRHPQLDNDTIFGTCSLEDRLNMTVPPGNDVTVNNGLSHCSVYNITLVSESCSSGNTSDVVSHSASPVNNGDGHYPGRQDPDTSKCTDGWVFDQSVFKSTMVTEWQLVCSGQHKAMAKSIASVFLAGRTVGNFAFGWLADRFGRRIVFLVTGLASTTTALISAFVPSYIPYTVLRFLQAAFASGKSDSGFILAVEYSGPSRRTIVASIYFAFWGIGVTIIPGIAYLIRDWRHLLIAITVPEFLVYVIFYFTVPESPRWLYLKKRDEKADKIVQKMAQVNGADLPESIRITEKADVSSVTPLDLMRTPRMRMVSFVLLVVWAAIGVVYYGVGFGINDLSGDIYINTLISGFIEIPADLLVIPLFAYGGRIPTFAGSMIAGGVLLLVAMNFQQDLSMQILFMTLLMFGKFFIIVAFAMIYMYCGECYPTFIRSMGVTFTAMGARISSPLAPYLLLLGSFYVLLPSIIFGGLSVLSGLLILMLPETKDTLLLQTVAEGEQFITDNRIKCCKKKRSRFRQPDDNSPVEMKCLNPDHDAVFVVNNDSESINKDIRT